VRSKLAPTAVSRSVGELRTALKGVEREIATSRAPSPKAVNSIPYSTSSASARSAALSFERQLMVANAWRVSELTQSPGAAFARTAGRAGHLHTNWPSLSLPSGSLFGALAGEAGV
jgi:hypothetical protein